MYLPYEQDCENNKKAAFKMTIGVVGRGVQQYNKTMDHQFIFLSCPKKE